MSGKAYGFDVPASAGTDPAEPAADAPAAPGVPVRSEAPAAGAPREVAAQTPPREVEPGVDRFAPDPSRFATTSYDASHLVGGTYGGAAPSAASPFAVSQYASTPLGAGDPGTVGSGPGSGPSPSSGSRFAGSPYDATPAAFGAVATLAPEAPMRAPAPAEGYATFQPIPEAPAAALPPMPDEDESAEPAPATAAESGRSPGAARRTLAPVRAFVLSAMLGAVVAVVAMFLLSIPLGFRSLTVMSGSMVPTLGVGDVVIERQIAPTDLKVGDIVTFRDPSDQQTLITHRVRSFKIHDGMVDVVTKGDANNTVEKWSIPVNGRLGVVVTHVPKLGYALVWASGRTGRIALIAIPGVILGIIELRRIWRPRRSTE